MKSHRQPLWSASKICTRLLKTGVYSRRAAHRVSAAGAEGLQAAGTLSWPLGRGSALRPPSPLPVCRIRCRQMQKSLIWGWMCVSRVTQHVPSAPVSPGGGSGTASRRGERESLAQGGVLTPERLGDVIGGESSCHADHVSSPSASPQPKTTELRRPLLQSLPSSVPFLTFFLSRHALAAAPGSIHGGGCCLSPGCPAPLIPAEPLMPAAGPSSPCLAWPPPTQRLWQNQGSGSFKRQHLSPGGRRADKRIHLSRDLPAHFE